jgi:hypothetical protein
MVIRSVQEWTHVDNWAAADRLMRLQWHLLDDGWHSGKAKAA